VTIPDAGSDVSKPAEAGAVDASDGSATPDGGGATDATAE
jgi:hypothetical protein